ncbi:cytochrome P450 [Microbulbifer sp. 2205BS26-8]|uniref:cytochrome P450 n=1 Tax=Microbulbifer sp. 2205BS26-8 TaxID=3064386 RepID=UPI00273DCF1E|nr:cytochrome P450 [Microbulbifer sp. 2205BS26-8]MDP5210193.1 cytochrome P450 [Microbulbifer sp. 2205BS26-8]
MDSVSTSEIELDKQLFSAEFIDNPYPIYRQLVAKKPIFHTEWFGGAWLVSSHALASAVLKDDRFSNNTLDYMNKNFTGIEKEQLQDLVEHQTRWMPYLRGDLHTNVRKLVHRALENALVNYNEKFHELALSLLTRLVEQREFDFISDYACIYPAQVISNVLGMDDETAVKIIQWSDQYHSYIGSNMDDYSLAKKALDALNEMQSHLYNLLKRPEKLAKNSLLSIFVNNQSELVETQVLFNQLTNLVVASYVNAHNVLGNALFTLLNNPDQLELLNLSPNYFPNAVRELIRFDSSTQIVPRRALETLELYGKTIQKGELLFILVGAANRDPAVFSNPEKLDITRKQNPHLAFGHGPHVCIGLHLTYVTVEIALKEFFMKIRDYDISLISSTRIQSIAFRGLQNLYVSLSNR